MTAAILIFGYGNPSRGDDALGPLLLDELDAHLPESARRAAGGIETLTDFQLQIEYALDLVGRRLVLFADADLSCPPPYRFECLRAAEETAYTTHALSPAALLRVYRQIHGREPPASFLLGIRGERFELGEPLTATARTHLDAAVARVLDLLAHPDPAYWRSRCTV
jgi:hydrogenase maturation protease